MALTVTTRLVTVERADSTNAAVEGLVSGVGSSMTENGVEGTEESLDSGSNKSGGRDSGTTDNCGVQVLPLAG